VFIETRDRQRDQMQVKQSRGEDKPEKAREKEERWMIHVKQSTERKHMRGNLKRQRRIGREIDY
jgi:hypothetical protein